MLNKPHQFSVHIAATDQAIRYGRQTAGLSPYPTPDMSYVFNSWQAFVAQFQGNQREVLVQIFWNAYNKQMGG